MATKLEIEHLPAADQADILALKEKIKGVQLGQIDEERFKHYRLTRGVYGQRQLGVQMFRTKIPFGRLNSKQLEALADASDRYSTGNLHLTTRQNVQLHHVRLNDAPALLAALATAGITALGACGNTVRNITASATAGINPKERFDVAPYVQTVFEYFLRNPVSQDMGRKIKIAFSATDEDSAFAYFHDFGFIPQIKNGARGFKVLLGGGLGAQAMVAQMVYDFLPEERLIAFLEASIRVFDRYGERAKRMKARLKFFIKQWGVEHFLNLVEQEYQGLDKIMHPIDYKLVAQPLVPVVKPYKIAVKPVDFKIYQQWRSTNVFAQKQAGYYGVFIKVRLGDIDSETARALAKIIQEYAADELRLTINQGILLKFVPAAYLVSIYNVLHAVGLADVGFGTILDITACPGTNTCNLAVTNSTGLANQLEAVLAENYPHLLDVGGLNIKISGCMNSCGQHMAANIGFHGSTIKAKNGTLPAMQIVLGGGVDPRGNGFIAEKIIKIATKRIPVALTWLLDDYEQQKKTLERFNDYVNRQGKHYFYQLLKALASKDDFYETDYWDWEQEENYRKAIGVGECAGVAFDLVSTILHEAKEKYAWAEQSFSNKAYADSIYWSYSGFVVAAKALLLSKELHCNTHIKIIEDFDQHFVQTGLIALSTSFSAMVLQMKTTAPTAEFAANYHKTLNEFLTTVFNYHSAKNSQDNLVLSEHYKA